MPTAEADIGAPTANDGKVSHCGRSKASPADRASHLRLAQLMGNPLILYLRLVDIHSERYAVD